MINLIWAMDINWLIGNNNKLPWRYQEDLDYFKRTTKNKIVLMGEKTYRSMKGYYKSTPFPFSQVYVASRTEKIDDVIMVRDVEEFLKNNKEELWVLGGSVIFNLALPYADNLYITWILKAYQGDTHFPEFNLVDDFHVISNVDGEDPELRFMVYGKNK